MALTHGPKDNSRKKGHQQAAKQKRRTDAEARQAAYAAIPLEEKLARAGAKEKAKLLAKSEKQNGARK